MQVKAIVLSALVAVSLTASAFAQTPTPKMAGKMDSKTGSKMMGSKMAHKMPDGKMMGGKMMHKMPDGKMMGGKMSGGKMTDKKMTDKKMAAPAPK